VVVKKKFYLLKVKSPLAASMSGKLNETTVAIGYFGSLTLKSGEEKMMKELPLIALEEGKCSRA
jgi:hypothetical protein